MTSAALVIDASILSINLPRVPRHDPGRVLRHRGLDPRTSRHRISVAARLPSSSPGHSRSPCFVDESRRVKNVSFSHGCSVFSSSFIPCEIAGNANAVALPRTCRASAAPSSAGPSSGIPSSVAPFPETPSSEVARNSTSGKPSRGQAKKGAKKGGQKKEKYYKSDDNDLEFGSIEEMQRWLTTKPKGFIDPSKQYDTSLEDQLLAEIEAKEQQKELEAAAGGGDKAGANAGEKAGEGKGEKQGEKKGRSKQAGDFDGPVKGKNTKESELPPSAIKVRVSGLPKKKKISRDLRAAWNGQPGLLKIIPMETGSSSTRDPVCTGSAVVAFLKLSDAERFIQQYNRSAPIRFGQKEKAVSCKIIGASADSSSLPQADRGKSTSVKSTSVKSSSVKSSSVKSTDATVTLGETAVQSSVGKGEVPSVKRDSARAAAAADAEETVEAPAAPASAPAAAVAPAADAAAAAAAAAEAEPEAEGAMAAGGGSRQVGDKKVADERKGKEAGEGEKVAATKGEKKALGNKVQGSDKLQGSTKLQDKKEVWLQRLREDKELRARVEEIKSRVLRDMAAAGKDGEGGAGGGEEVGVKGRWRGEEGGLRGREEEEWEEEEEEGEWEEVEDEEEWEEAEEEDQSESEEDEEEEEEEEEVIVGQVEVTVESVTVESVTVESVTIESVTVESDISSLQSHGKAKRMPQAQVEERLEASISTEQGGVSAATGKAASAAAAAAAEFSRVASSPISLSAKKGESEQQRRAEEEEQQRAAEARIEALEAKLLKLSQAGGGENEGGGGAGKGKRGKEGKKRR
ncbi:hypothetical protein CLOP_g7635 [Closterium sp. NIES-67]|nr:hypothetical protein CLOP_g7635 [Closterium sp. NIES-67]